MEKLKYPKRKDWEAILARPTFNDSALNKTVQDVLDDVRARGDSAVLEYSEKFDKVKLSSLEVTGEELLEAQLLVKDDLKQAIRIAKQNIETFHKSQQLESKKIETTQGVTCWQRAVGIEKVGLYIPGGTAPLFSTILMLAIPAQIAGCREIVICTPPNIEGKIHPAILFAAKEAGISKIYKAGGIQAIGAMAYGTQTIPKVYKIFGPGNQYVMKAKQLVSIKDVAIDMPAGPSEVLVLADSTANAAFVAADLLSQAEHGADSQVIFVTTDEQMLGKVEAEVEKQLLALPRQQMVEKALSHSRLILLQSEEEMVELTNQYAPEHLIIQTESYMDLADKIVNAGSVFLGNYTPESAGDYASGTNHTLPTNAYAKAYSGVNLDSFVKKITYQEITKEGIRNLGSTIEIMAENEGLFAHKNAVTLRMNPKPLLTSSRGGIADALALLGEERGVWSFKQIEYNSVAYIEMIELRNTVLLEPIGLPYFEEVLEKDDESMLCVCVADGEIIACCVLTELNKQVVQLRQMAVAANMQGQKVGAKLIAFAEAEAKADGYTEIRIHARRVAERFYLQNGYSFVGEEFMEVEIPHMEMRKKI